MFLREILTLYGMALSDDDLKAVKRLLDGHLAEFQARERRRRRWGLIVFLVLLVGPIIPGLFIARDWWAEFKNQQDKDLAEARAAYQRELAKSQIMRKERDEAVARVKYNGDISDADYQAGLMRSMIQLYNQQAQVRERLQNADADDPESLEATADALSDMLDASLGTLMQMALRNTDSAQNPPPSPQVMSDAKEAASPTTSDSRPAVSGAPSLLSDPGPNGASQ